MSKSLEAINTLLGRMQRDEAVTILQIKNIRTLVEDRELYLIERADSLSERLEKLEERRVQPQQVKRPDRAALHLVGRGAPQKRDDGLTKEFRTWLT